MQRFYRIIRLFAQLLLALAFGAALIWMVIYANQAPMTELKGLARVVDGDSLEMRSEKIRIVGIDAPEFDQSCGNVKNQWPCGQQSKSALAKLIDNKTVRCAVQGFDKYRRSLAICYVEGKDIGKWMVTNGWAVSFGDYGFDEAIARRNRLGIWQGEFEMPKDWRRNSGANTDIENPISWLWRNLGF